jgi:hypothetical protein
VWPPLAILLHENLFGEVPHVFRTPQVGEQFAKSDRRDQFVEPIHGAGVRVLVVRFLFGSGASLRKVAARAGCSTGAVTYYFENKEAMVAKVTEALFDEFDGWLSDQSSVDIRAILDRMIRWTAASKGDALAGCFSTPGSCGLRSAAGRGYPETLCAIPPQACESARKTDRRKE